MTPRHYQSTWLQPKKATLKLPGSDPRKEPRAVSLDNRMPSTKSELPTIKDEELSASLDGRENLNPSRKSAFSPHEQASPQKRDNSSNGYHDNTNYDGGTSKPASKSSSKTSSPFTKEDEAVFFILGIHAQVDPRQHNHPTKNYEDDDDDGNNYDHDDEAQIASLCL